MKYKYKYLFNFSVSKTTGGLKRLFHFAKWFHQNGGAYFIIHPECDFLLKKFPNNRYFVIYQNSLRRIFNDYKYLSLIKKEITQFDLYYSYAIPVYYHFGKINWFHVSNILPLSSRPWNLKLSLFDRFLRLNLLGFKIKKNFQNADIVSAESKNSLKIIKNQNIKEFFLSINGSDDELNYLEKKLKVAKENIAIIIGTQNYKAILESFFVFEYLKKQNKLLKLIIIGNSKNIPKKIINNNSVTLMNTIKHNEVIEFLQKSKYYISTTKIENSFNAASEGIIFCNESYISDIPPHRELLENETYEIVSIPKLSHKMIKTKKNDIKGKNLITWDNVIKNILKKVESYK